VARRGLNGRPRFRWRDEILTFGNRGRQQLQDIEAKQIASNSTAGHGVPTTPMNALRCFLRPFKGRSGTIVAAARLYDAQGKASFLNVPHGLGRTAEISGFGPGTAGHTFRAHELSALFSRSRRGLSAVGYGCLSKSDLGAMVWRRAAALPY